MFLNKYEVHHVPWIVFSSANRWCLGVLILLIKGFVKTHQKSAAVDVLSIIYWKTNCEGVLFLQIQTNYRQVSLVNINHDMHYPSHWVFIFSEVAFISNQFFHEKEESISLRPKPGFRIISFQNLVRFRYRKGVGTFLKLK